jgi:hypothetical protein
MQFYISGHAFVMDVLSQYLVLTQAELIWLDAELFLLDGQ